MSRDSDFYDRLTQADLFAVTAAVVTATHGSFIDVWGLVVKEVNATSPSAGFDAKGRLMAHIAEVVRLRVNDTQRPAQDRGGDLTEAR